MSAAQGPVMSGCVILGSVVFALGPVAVPVGNDRSFVIPWPDDDEGLEAVDDDVEAIAVGAVCEAAPVDHFGVSAWSRSRRAVWRAYARARRRSSISAMSWRMAVGGLIIRRRDGRDVRD